MEIERQYIVDEHNHKVAVQLDIKIFEKIEETLENYALYRLMQEDSDDELLNGTEAREYYSSLEKQ